MDLIGTDTAEVFRFLSLAFVIFNVPIHRGPMLTLLQQQQLNIFMKFLVKIHGYARVTYKFEKKINNQIKT